MENLLQRVRAALARRYEVASEAGRGAMAIVYRAVDRRHDRTVAVKVLRPQLASAVGQERFLHEIRLAAGLAHPYILPVLDSGESDGLLYYVMPFVEGETLGARVAREGELPVGDAVKIASEIAEALGHAHAAGILHRDVKPSNILLTESHALLADFGIARALDRAGDEQLTATGLSVGSPAYMSPQQADPEAAPDPRDDQYSLACVLYEMLAGAPPFTGGSATAVMRRHAADAVPPVRTVRPAVPAGVDAAIGRAMAKSPADRFGSMDEFAGALAAEGAAAGSSEASRPGRWRRVLTTLLLFAVAAVAVWQVPRFDASMPGENDSAWLGLAIPACIPSSEADLSDARHVAQMTSVYLSQLELQLPPVPWDYLAAWPAKDGLARGAVIRSDANPRLFDAGDVPQVLAELRAKYFVHCYLHPETAGHFQLDLQLFDRDGEVARDTLIIFRDTINAGVADLAATLVRRIDPGLGSRIEGWSDSVQAWRHFFHADSAFRAYDLNSADSLFGLAVQVDPNFGLASWHQSLVHRWRAIPETSGIDLDSLLEADRARFGPRDLMLIEAETAPAVPGPDGRFERLEAVIQAYPADAYPRLVYADELFHRGALAETGIAIDSAHEVLREAIELTAAAAWGPAWDHLTLTNILLGDQDGARAALHELCTRFPVDPTEFEPCNYWTIGYHERFHPDSAATVYRPLLKSQPDSVLLRAARFTRYANLYDAELDLGAALVTRGTPPDSLWLSGKNAMGIAHMAMGQPANALEHFKDAGGTGTRARLLADLWVVIPGALELEGFIDLPPEERLRASASLSDLATADGTDSLSAARAAWGLALSAAASGDRSAFNRWRALVDSIAPPDEMRRARLTRLLDAAGVARFDADADSALTLSAPLMLYDTLVNIERPFGRSVLYLLRGKWHAEAGDPQTALNAWMWHANFDLEALPTRDVQGVEVDGALAGWARLWSARLAREIGDAERACREAREALNLWWPRHRSPRNPEQTILQQVVELRSLASSVCGVPP